MRPDDSQTLKPGVGWPMIKAKGVQFHQQGRRECKMECNFPKLDEKHILMQGSGRNRDKILLIGDAIDRHQDANCTLFALGKSFGTANGKRLRPLRSWTGQSKQFCTTFEVVQKPHRSGTNGTRMTSVGLEDAYCWSLSWAAVVYGSPEHYYEFDTNFQHARCH